MARMLQALKNLEARSAPKQASPTPRPGPPAPLPASAPSPEGAPPTAILQPAAPISNDPQRQVTSHIHLAAAPPATPSTTARPGPPAPLPASAPSPEGAASTAIVEPAVPISNDPEREVTSHIDFAAAALANLSITANNPFWPGPEFTTPTYDIASLSVAV